MATLPAPPSPFVLARVFIPFALGYFLSFLTRVVNAVIAPDLVRELNLSAADLGFLTSVYFLAFAAFQLPLGVALDRFGPRRTAALLLLVAALGAVLFATAQGTTMLTVGRALMGLGVSGCLMAPFTAYRTWFPVERLPLVNGWQMAAGGLGALTGTVPIEALLRFTDWRGVFVVFAVAIVAGSAIIYFVVPRRGVEGVDASLAIQIKGFVNVFRSPLFRRVAPLTMASQGTFLGIQSLWSGPWLRDVAGLDRPDVANTLLLIALAMIGGFLAIGAIAERLGRYGIRTITVALVGIVAFQLVQLALVLQWTTVTTPLWMLFGFFGTGNVLCYTALSQTFPAQVAGRVNSGLNLLVFITAFAVQWGIGAVIGLWPTTTDGGYAPAGYQAAFGVMLAIQALALAWYGLYRNNTIKV